MPSALPARTGRRAGTAPSGSHAAVAGARGILRWRSRAELAPLAARCAAVPRVLSVHRRGLFALQAGPHPERALHPHLRAGLRDTTGRDTAGHGLQHQEVPARPSLAPRGWRGLWVLCGTFSPSSARPIPGIDSTAPVGLPARAAFVREKPEGAAAAPGRGLKGFRSVPMGRLPHTSHPQYPRPHLSVPQVSSVLTPFQAVPGPTVPGSVRPDFIPSPLRPQSQERSSPDGL